ncbi:MAG: YqgE/AlgH family protein [Gammaproteobacteria bacterium]|jgi:putative transcriptional regulator
MSRIQVFALGFLTAVAVLIALLGLNRPPAEQAVLMPAVDRDQDEGAPAAGMFLVARRALADPYFAGAVVLLLEHGSHGTLGLIVNRRFHITLAEALPDLGLPQADQHRVFFGGPLGSHQVFMLLRGDQPVADARHVAADIYFSADRDVLDEALEKNLPGDTLHFYLGYASWTAGQLAYEITRGSWHLIPGNSSVVFDAASDRLWKRLIDELEPQGIEVRHKGGDTLLAALPD